MRIQNNFFFIVLIGILSNTLTAQSFSKQNLDVQAGFNCSFNSRIYNYDSEIDRPLFTLKPFIGFDYKLSESLYLNFEFLAGNFGYAQNYKGINISTGSGGQVESRKARLIYNYAYTPLSIRYFFGDGEKLNGAKPFIGIGGGPLYLINTKRRVIENYENDRKVYNETATSQFVDFNEVLSAVQIHAGIDKKLNEELKLRTEIAYIQTLSNLYKNDDLNKINLFNIGLQVSILYNLKNF